MLKQAAQVHFTTLDRNCNDMHALFHGRAVRLMSCKILEWLTRSQCFGTELDEETESALLPLGSEELDLDALEGPTDEDSSSSATSHSLQSQEDSDSSEGEWILQDSALTEQPGDEQEDSTRVAKVSRVRKDSEDVFAPAELYADVLEDKSSHRHQGKRKKSR